jgi:hypothetical protein
VHVQKAGLVKEARLLVENGIANIMKKLSPAQKKLARAAKPYNKITGADFKALKKRKKRK